MIVSEEQFAVLTDAMYQQLISSKNESKLTTIQKMAFKKLAASAVRTGGFESPSSMLAKSIRWVTAVPTYGASIAVGWAVNGVAAAVAAKAE
tara:strand:+ start:288 stop:563 length:276 start_codon:yes stop_codon:yes gene_type:complete